MSKKPIKYETPEHESALLVNRRHFLSRTSLGIGGAALASLLPGCMPEQGSNAFMETAVSQALQFAPRARRVIYLFQSGGPSQMDLFDYKPALAQLHGQELPDSVRQGQRLTGMTANQSTFPMANSMYQFAQHGESRAWVSELMPYTAKIVDDLCFIKSMHTEAINHDPAITFFQTGSQQPGRPSMGAWLSYGLGSENEDLPTFTVLLSRGLQRPQPIYSRLWGAGFLASMHQGVQFRSGSKPVLYLDNPPGINDSDRRRALDHLCRVE